MLNGTAETGGQLLSGGGPAVRQAGAPIDFDPERAQGIAEGRRIRTGSPRRGGDHDLDVGLGADSLVPGGRTVAAELSGSRHRHRLRHHRMGTMIVASAARRRAAVSHGEDGVNNASVRRSVDDVSAISVPTHFRINQNVISARRRPTVSAPGHTDVRREQQTEPSPRRTRCSSIRRVAVHRARSHSARSRRRCAGSSRRSPGSGLYAHHDGDPGVTRHPPQQPTPPTGSADGSIWTRPCPVADLVRKIERHPSPASAPSARLALVPSVSRPSPAADGPCCRRPRRR